MYGEFLLIFRACHVILAPGIRCSFFNNFLSRHRFLLNSVFFHFFCNFLTVKCREGKGESAAGGDYR